MIPAPAKMRRRLLLTFDASSAREKRVLKERNRGNACMRELYIWSKMHQMRGEARTRESFVHERCISSFGDRVKIVFIPSFFPGC